MAQKEYRSRFDSDIVKALMKAKDELGEDFFIISMDFDASTNEYIYTVEASDVFHSKATSYL
jgi:hypothetical protein